MAVVGQVGASKTSLMSAMLGEMEKLQGTVSVKVKSGEILGGGSEEFVYSVINSIETLWNRALSRYKVYFL